MFNLNDLYKLADVSGVKFQTLAEDAELYQFMSTESDFNKVVQWVNDRYKSVTKKV